MDIGIAEGRKSEKNIGGGAEGHPKSIQIDTSEGNRYRLAVWFIIR